MAARAPGGSASEFRTAVHRLIRAPRGLRYAYVAVFAASLAIRIVLAAAVKPVLLSDARDYHELARSLMEGRGYVQVYEGETQAFNGFTFRAFRSPGYPVILAGLYKVFGRHPGVYLGLNIVADEVTQVCALLIAAYLFGAGPALLVQILLAIHVLWTLNPMTEAVHAAMIALLALLLVVRAPLKSWAGALGFGVLAAAALFIRPITLCVFPVLVWRYLWCNPSWRRLPLIGLAVLPSVLGVTAWAVRNHRLLGQYVLFTTNFGHHNALAYGIPPDEAFAHFRQQGLNEAEIDRELTRLEWNLVKANPSGWAWLWCKRVRGLFSLAPPWEVGVALWDVMFPKTPRVSWIGRCYRASYYQYYLTYLLFACGAIILIIRRQGLEGLWTFMLGYVAFHAALSRGDVRLLAPLYPLLCMLAAGLWASAVAILQRRQPSHKGRAR